MKSISVCFTPILLLFIHPANCSSVTSESVHNPLSIQLPVISGKHGFCIGCVKRLHECDRL